MNNKGKTAVIILGIGALGGLVYALTRKKEEPPPGEAAASIEIAILDVAGNPIHHNSPTNLLEGMSYTLIATVTNQSTKLGQPTAATLSLRTYCTLAGLISDSTQNKAFTAGQSWSFSFPFNVPVGFAGQFGVFYASVLDPTGAILANAYLDVNVVARVATGTIGYLKIYYAGIPSANWEDFVSGSQVPAGIPIFLAVGWVNHSSFNIVGHMELTANGTPLVATMNQDREAVPMNGWLVQFESVTLAEGTYTFTATLSSGGQILDTKTFTLVGVAPIIYGATVTIS